MTTGPSLLVRWLRRTLQSSPQFSHFMLNYWETAWKKQNRTHTHKASICKISGKTTELYQLLSDMKTNKLGDKKYSFHAIKFENTIILINSWLSYKVMIVYVKTPLFMCLRCVLAHVDTCATSWNHKIIFSFSHLSNL